MSINQEMVGDAGLRIFGKISASISHEIKNALAVINENAGLMKDLIIMSDKGMPIDLERIKTLAGKVSEQVRRADGIVQNMNRFAHSVDDSFKRLDVDEYLGLVADLSRRFAVMREVRLESEHPSDPVKITTSPFLLESLIFLCLDYAMEAAGEGKTVGMIVEESQEGVQIKFTGLEALPEMPKDRFPADRERALLRGLKAELEVDAGAGLLIITLPEEIGP